ncbi:VOC family protein [Mucilaginibacter sp. RS28]|uniref:VOC family protein n=1 Tax=Mucilaginibacter straminoryzae TaxID=2932774 RepID=A0A9X2BD23_9SPHI|nr:VOC family protein [Mucilaginibacter straminoryzae]MCJ8211622.1 VOC family protein [Mucilaginibacter straminoryzae]
MKLRVARHTASLQPVVDFYCSVLGLQVLGSFNDHDGYDGVFLGLPGLGWHLEFTQSSEEPVHQPDEDDLLVFYLSDVTDQIAIVERYEAFGGIVLEAKNPYWNSNGATIADPDGFRIVIAIAKTT